MKSKQEQLWDLQNRIIALESQISQIKNVLSDHGLITLRDGCGYTYIQLRKKE